MTSSIPSRQTASSIPPGVDSGFDTFQLQSVPFRASPFPWIDPTDHYARSQHCSKRVPLPHLRAFADTIPVQAAISRIVDGVTRMPWSIQPPEDKRDDEAALKQARLLEEALLEPTESLEGIDTYPLFVSSLVTDLLVQNVAVVERQGQGKSEKAFWLWVIDPERIRLNKKWEPQKAGATPRYFDTLHKPDPRDWRALLDEDLFLIRRFANSWRINSPGPLEVAFRMVAAWLGLTDFQRSTTSQASQEWLLDIGPSSQDELDQFRQFFEIEVIQRKKLPIIGTREGGRGLQVVKLGASSDAQLYLNYYEKLLRIIALAFKLTARDMNETDHDNRSTAGVSADSTFQDAILPMALTITSALQKNVIKAYYEGYTLELADTEPRDQMQEAQTVDILYKGGLITLNEARLDVGRKAIGPSGDKFSTGTTIDGEESEQPVPGVTAPKPGEEGTKPKTETGTPREDADENKKELDQDKKKKPKPAKVTVAAQAKSNRSSLPIEIRASASVQPVQLTLFG